MNNCHAIGSLKPAPNLRRQGNSRRFGSRKEKISVQRRGIASALPNVLVDPHQDLPLSEYPPLGPPTAAMKLTGPILALIAKLLSGSSVRWIECQPDTCQRVYFANHTSHLDALVLWASLPREVRQLTRPVAAKDYWEKGAVRRYLAQTFNTLLIDRRKIKVHQSPVDMMLKEIGNEQSLIVFPEGGRSEAAGVGEFKSGLYYLGKKRPDLELVPVYIDNMNRVLPRGEFLPVPLLSCITFGPPIWLESGEPKVDFLERARTAVCRLKDI